jgi:hypothetical protein
LNGYLLRYDVDDEGSYSPKVSDKLSSEKENQLAKYFGPTNSESVREDHTFADLGSLGEGFTALQY